MWLASGIIVHESHYRFLLRFHIYFSLGIVIGLTINIDHWQLLIALFSRKLSLSIVHCRWLLVLCLLLLQRYSPRMIIGSGTWAHILLIILLLINWINLIFLCIQKLIVANAAGGRIGCQILWAVIVEILTITWKWRLLLSKLMGLLLKVVRCSIG